MLKNNLIFASCEKKTIFRRGGKTKPLHLKLIGRSLSMLSSIAVDRPGRVKRKNIQWALATSPLSTPISIYISTRKEVK